MNSLLLILLLVLSFSLSAQDKAALTPLLKTLETLPDSMSGVACSEADIDRKLTKTKLKDERGKEFEVSEISEDYLNELFSYLAGQKYIPFHYPEEGCYARAHEMVRLLEEKGIIAGKVFVDGKMGVNTPYSPKGYVDWGYHVAPVLSVRTKDGGTKLYVIDPSVYDKAVPLQEWEEKLTFNSDKKKVKTYFSPRFKYMPVFSLLPADHYRQKDFISTKEELAKFLKLQIEREKGQKP